jgi:Uncharacterised nucleotidyltransferase
MLECASPRPNAERLGELLREPLDWPALLALAEEHGVMGLLANRLLNCSSDFVPLETRKKLKEWGRAQLVFTLSMTAELFRLLELFAAGGVDALVVKGPVLSMRAYGDFGMRQYIDLDLLVRHEKIHRASELMIAAGYQSAVPLGAISAGKIPGEYLFLRPDAKLLMELHTGPTFRYYPRPMPVEKLFQRKDCVVLNAHAVPALSMEDELVMVCIHAAKHFWERLMWIADVAAISFRQTGLDWERATEAAREVGAERMLHVGLRLAKDVFAAPIPPRITAVAYADKGAGKLVRHITRRLLETQASAPGIVGRGLFRMRMRGGFFTGPAYLLRLALSPTEQDWREARDGRHGWLLDALRRPFRLARKYRGEGNE